MAWNDLLNYFKQEKNFFRKMAQDFSLKFPKVAGYLDYGSHQSNDPQIERLVESVAYLCANIQQKLDGDFPEITTGLLNLLYPSLVNPIPSMSIAQLLPDFQNYQAGERSLVPAQTPLVTETEFRAPCHFRTIYPVQMLPIQVNYAGIESSSQFDFLHHRGDIYSVLRIRLEILGSNTFSSIGLKKMRFYLNGDAMVVSGIYETLFNHVQEILVLSDTEDEPIQVGKEQVTPVGFYPDETLLPSSKQGQLAYQLIQEYFCFPEKFHFMDVGGLEVVHADQEIDLLFLLDTTPHLDIDEEHFLLGCTPIVNLFEEMATPITIEPGMREVPIVSNLRHEDTTEIYSIQSVQTTEEGGGAATTVEPFYEFRYELEGKDQKALWYSRREIVYHPEVTGSQLFLSFRHLDSSPATPPANKLYIRTLCSNRDLAGKLPNYSLFRPDQKLGIASAQCIKKPTASIQPPLGGRSLWNLISSLTVNHLSLSEGEASLEALREILSLYNFSNQAINEQQLLGIKKLECRPVISHVGFEGWRGFHRGLEINLTLDREYFAGSSPLLLGAVLRHFFSLHVSVHSFTETVLRKTESEGEWVRFKILSGIRPLL